MNRYAASVRRLKLQERILPLRMLNMYNWRSPSQRIAEKRDASFSIGCAGCLPSTNGNMPNGYSPMHLLPGMEMSIWARGLDFNAHGKHHIIRAAQEGIVFSFKYGIDIMEQMGIPVKMIHAGHANMFLSSIFRDTLAGVTGATIELYDTDGSVGAAKGAGIGAGIYKDNNEAFATLDKLDVIEPNVAKRQEYADAYAKWKYRLEKSMTGNIPAPVLSSDK